jgi:hypothetical protein
VHLLSGEYHIRNVLCTYIHPRNVQVRLANVRTVLVNVPAAEQFSTLGLLGRVSFPIFGLAYQYPTGMHIRNVLYPPSYPTNVPIRLANVQTVVTCSSVPLRVELDSIRTGCQGGSPHCLGLSRSCRHQLDCMTTIISRPLAALPVAGCERP